MEILGIKIESRRKYGARNTFITKCSSLNCNNTLQMRSKIPDEDKFCLSCQNKKRPFESLYNTFCTMARIYNKAGRRNVEISYEDFLEFTKISKCHYCFTPINWQEYRIENGKYKNNPNSYYLDRKDSNIGYLMNNIVVCCTRCNRGKSNQFSYDEWLGMTEYFRK